ncbi:MAG: polysaccharide deacetylase family protein [Candidatus Wallbacteria bacterium]|nr:polysaccharide deacetylase family protein [Candidatus Wallbacteria bacterium]
MTLSRRLRVSLLLLASLELAWTCWAWTHPPVPVLLFHGISETGGPLDFWTLKPAVFRAILDRIERLGFHTVDDEGLLAAFGSFRGYSRLVVLTFDDGLASHRELVAPELLRRGMRGLFFVTRRGGPGRLSDGDVRGLPASRLRVGSHSATHGLLVRREREDDEAFRLRLIREIAFPRAQLRRLTGQTILSFAYPGGDVSLEAREMVLTAGYRFGFTADYGSPSPWTDRTLLPRDLLFSDATPAAVEAYMTEPLRWLRLRAVFDVLALMLLLASFVRERIPAGSQ